MEDKRRLLATADQIKDYCDNRLECGCTDADLLAVIEAQLDMHRHLYIKDKLPRSPAQLASLKEALNNRKKYEEPPKTETRKAQGVKGKKEKATTSGSGKREVSKASSGKVGKSKPKAASGGVRKDNQATGRSTGRKEALPDPS